MVNLQSYRVCTYSLENNYQSYAIDRAYDQRDFKIENEANSKVLKYVFDSGLQK